MIQGIVLCFAFLFAQLAVLHYIDRRFASPEDPVMPATSSGDPESGSPE